MHIFIQLSKKDCQKVRLFCAGVHKEFVIARMFLILHVLGEDSISVSPTFMEKALKTQSAFYS